MSALHVNDALKAQCAARKAERANEQLADELRRAKGRLQRERQRARRLEEELCAIQADTISQDDGDLIRALAADGMPVMVIAKKFELHHRAVAAVLGSAA